MKCLSLVLVLLCSACSSWRPTAPKATVSTPQGSIVQDGPAESPATLETSTTATETPIPPGSRVTIETPPAPASPGPVSSPAPILVSRTNTTHLSGPKAYTPPAPPTPAQHALGVASIWAWAGIALGVAAFAFGLVRGWDLVMTGGICVALGSGAILLFGQAPWLFGVIGAGLALKFAGPYLWHRKVKPIETKTDETKNPPVL